MSPTLRSQDNAIPSSIMEQAAAAATPQARPFIGPPTFKGTPEESVTEWLTCYEHVASLNTWDADTKVKFLYLALEGDAKKWYTTQILTGAPDSWEAWTTRIKSCFSSRHAAEIAHLRLQNRIQLPSERPEQYYYDVMQLCARLDPTMTEEDRLRHLLRGLSPSTMEKIVISNPGSCAEFLQILQRINQAALMARASCTPTSFPLPGMQPWTPTIPGTASAALATTQSSPVSHLSCDHPHVTATCAAGQHVQRQDANADNRALRAISESIEALTARIKAIEEQVRRPPVPWPPKTSRGDDGRPRCQYCQRPGHVARQCHQWGRDEEQQQGRRERPGERAFDSGNRNGRA